MLCAVSDCERFLEEMSVRRLIAALVLVAVSSGAAAPEATSTYWGLETADGSTWCGYADKGEFDAEASKDPPERSASVEYSSRGELLEIDQQMQDFTGDWTVVDIYRPSKDGVHLERHSVGRGGRVVLETTIRGGKAEPFRITSGSSEASRKTAIPASARLDDIPFKEVAAEMHDRSIRRLCKRGGVTVPTPVGVLRETAAETYWLLRKNNGNTWCGYTRDVGAGAAAVVTYASAAVREIRLTFLHGAYWEVFDRYAPSGSDWLLRRETLLNLWNQNGSLNRSLQVVQVTTIHEGKAEPFRVVSAYDSARLEYGDPTQQPDLSNVDLSPVPVSANPSGETFMKVVSEMRDKHLDELCRSTQ
jgi:hypothetical protein